MVGTLLLACLVGSLARAGDAVSPIQISGSLGLTSDFVFRGLSLTRGKPALQAALDLELPREFYAGGFIATADPNAGPSPNLEFDLWAGRYWRLDADWSVDLRLSQYHYPDDPRRVSYDRTEFTTTVGFRNRVFAAAIYSPNTRAVGGAPGYHDSGAWAVEVSARHVFDERWSLSAGAGHYGLEGVYYHSFSYFNATLIADLQPWELQFAWLGALGGADHLFPEDSVGSRITATALWRFSH